MDAVNKALKIAKEFSEKTHRDTVSLDPLAAFNPTVGGPDVVSSLFERTLKAPNGPSSYIESNIAENSNSPSKGHLASADERQVESSDLTVKASEEHHLPKYNIQGGLDNLCEPIFHVNNVVSGVSTAPRIASLPMSCDLIDNEGPSSSLSMRNENGGQDPARPHSAPDKIIPEGIGKYRINSGFLGNASRILFFVK